VLASVAAVFDIPLEDAPNPAGVIRSTPLKDLRIVAILAEPARTKDGVLIVPAGSCVSPILMERLRNFARLKELEEPRMISG
jgi:hypothetical protein